MGNREEKEKYVIVVMRRIGGSAEVVRDGRVPEGGGMRHRIRAEERAEYRRREEELEGARGDSRAVRLMWHWIARSEWVTIPHISYIEKRRIERTYRNVYGKKI